MDGPLLEEVVDGGVEDAHGGEEGQRLGPCGQVGVGDRFDAKHLFFYCFHAEPLLGDDEGKVEDPMQRPSTRHRFAYSL